MKKIIKSEHKEIKGEAKELFKNLAFFIRYFI